MSNNYAAKLLVAGIFLSSLINSAEASVTGVKITEWMYNPKGTAALGEFVEFTNFGPTAVDFTNWSFDDNTRLPGSQSLSLFGSVASGESVILTDNDANAFRTAWGLASTVKVIGGNTNNLGANDEINLYNGSTLVDSLTYSTSIGPSTNKISGIPGSIAALGANNAALWVLSTVGNSDGAYTSLTGDIGSPGLAKSSFAPVSSVPVPAAVWLFGTGLLGLLGRTRKCTAS
jgi:predicted extracellular nuclease